MNTRWSERSEDGINLFSDEIKDQLLEILQKESAVYDVESQCDMYLLAREVLSDRPRPKDDRQSLETLIESTQNFIEASDKLLKDIHKITPKLHDQIYHHYKHRYMEKNDLPPSIRSYHLAGSLIEPIDKATMRIRYIQDFLSTITNEKPFRKRAKSKDLPGRHLISELFKIYEEATGKPVARCWNEIDVIESSPVGDIVKILDPLLNCGTLAGIIREFVDSQNQQQRINDEDYR